MNYFNLLGLQKQAILFLLLLDIGLRKILRIFTVRHFLNELKTSNIGLGDGIMKAYLRILKSMLENEVALKSFFEEDGLNVLVSLMDNLIQSRKC